MKDEITYLAVPVAVLMAVSTLIGQMKHDEVDELLLQVRACLNDRHKVKFSTEPAMDAHISNV